MTSIVHLIPSLAGGGAERQLAMLACEQHRRGMCVQVATRREGVHAGRLRAAGVPIHLLGDYRGLNPLLLVKIRRLLRELGPDLVQTWLPQMDLVGGMAAMTRSIPWILSERTSDLAFPRFSPTSGARTLLGQRASAIVANSITGAQYWKRRLSAGAPVEVIVNALDVPAIQAAPPSNLGLPFEGRSLILVVGRLSEEKRTDLVLRAIGLVRPQFEFLVVFVGDGPGRAALEAASRAPLYRDRVALVGYNPQWWGLLKTARGLLSASRYEGSPNVVLEAMAAGCPLIVSDIPAHREILDERAALLVRAEDPEALAAAMQTLLCDPTAARQRAEQASGRVGDRTIQKATDAYDHIYQQVIAGRRRQCAES